MPFCCCAERNVAGQEVIGEKYDDVGFDGDLEQEPDTIKYGMTERKRHREKRRLQKLVQDFISEGKIGLEMRVSLDEDIESGHETFMTWTLDESLKMFTLTGGSRSFTISFDDIETLTKGVELFSYVPEFPEEKVGFVVGVVCTDQRLAFHFPNNFESEKDRTFQRDKFYTCMKLLQRSYQIVSNKNEEEEYEGYADSY
eukprot:GHVL01018726.1.p1 GENE.GHVL01018726.1~~GHVL01018726.1.p1  ORF type:complete len:199 (+),score=29.34 GHVL01018726.1:90-686(+)